MVWSQRFDLYHGTELPLQTNRSHEGHEASSDLQIIRPNDMEIVLNQKKKRKELCGAEGDDDTDDPCLLARRWVDSMMNPPDTRSPCGSQCVAVWLSWHRLAVVTTIRGKILSSMGVPGPSGKLCLFAEEVFYLAERGLITLFNGGAQKVPCIDQVPADPAKAQLSPLYAENGELLAALTSSAGVSLPCYLAYRCLRDRQLVVRRRQPETKRVDWERPQSELLTYSPPQRLDSECILFETYPWTSTFSKNRCGSPTSLVLVVKTGDPAPALAPLHSLAATIQGISSHREQVTPFVESSGTLALGQHEGSRGQEGAFFAQSSDLDVATVLEIASVDDEGRVHIMHVSALRTRKPTYKKKIRAH